MSPAQLLSRAAFNPPRWAASLHAPRHGRILLGHLPTPLMPWACPALKELDVQWWLKRDDMSGFELAGNKVRKLEFLLAEAVAGQYDCVVTVGGLQSNHCRATAAAAAMLGLEAHVILLVSDRVAESASVGLAGNLLLDRLCGAKVHLCSASDYRQEGGDLAAMDRLCVALCDQLRGEGKHPYTVPVGGTMPLSAWAYINAIQELQDQLVAVQSEGGPGSFDHIVFAVGSGGTATGMVLGSHLSGLLEHCTLHGVNVQHSPDSFYQGIAAEAREIGLADSSCDAMRKRITIHDGSSIAYGHANADLLRMIRDVACTSGVVLDHIYSGKALYYFIMAARRDPERFRGKKVLFWHTGGQFALFAKDQRLAEFLDPNVVQPFRRRPFVPSKL